MIKKYELLSHHSTSLSLFYICPIQVYVGKGASLSSLFLSRFLPIEKFIDIVIVRSKLLNT
jgi:hypothetical protein